MRSKIAQKWSNPSIAKLFRSVAAALELSPGDNSFRISAYERAADSIDHSTSEIKDLWDDRQLDQLPGIGESMTEHLDELFRTGSVKHFQKILRPFPPALFELLEIPSLGPKKAFRLCKALGISDAHSAIKELETAAKKGHIASIEGFGPDSEAQILQNIADFKKLTTRMLYPTAESIAGKIIDWMRALPSVKSADSLGSLRRKMATVGDIDISISTDKPELAIHHFTKYPKAVRVIESGPVSATILLPDNITVDLMTASPDRYGSLLQHFTGSKLHNIALREWALEKGVSLSEYGAKIGGKTHTFSTEADLYKYFGLQYIPPELREGDEEIELAKKNQLPDLIDQSQISGDLHIHSDIDIEPSHDLGVNSLTELATAGKDLGYSYIGLTEHNPSFSQHTVSQMIELIKTKTQTICEFNSSHENQSEKYPYVLNGLEIDIRADGKRAVPDMCLDLLDYACVSIHSSFNLSRKAMTQRVIAGLSHPKVRFLAHPTSRLLKQREGIDLDWEQIFDFCSTSGKWLEINCSPDRLDLPDILVKRAVNKGISMVINSDSHSTAQFANMRLGVNVAKRGYATAKNVINTLPFAKLIKILGKEVN